MSESHRRARIIASNAKSAARTLDDRQTAAKSLADAGTRKALKAVAKPNSVSGALRKAGVALILAPDPVTGVAGVVMVGASLAARGKKPLSPTAVYEETQKLLKEMDSFF